MRVVITGASGLVGANLAAELCRQGHEVVATRRGQSRVEHLAHLPLRWVSADLSDADGLARAFEGAERVFHCAAVVAMSRRATPAQIDGNVEGTRRVLRAARQAGVGRVLHCSSVSAIGLREDGEPADEEVAWNYPRFGLDDGYCTTKHLAEEAVREELAQHPDLDVVIANPTYMFGPMDARPSSGALIVDLVRGRIPATSPGINNYVDVRDVARGIWAVAERGRRGQRYILGGQEHSYADIMALIARLAGCPAPRLQLPRWVAAIGGYLGDLNESLLGAEPRLNSATVAFAYTRHFRFRCDLAQQELGYRAGPIEPAIEAALAWFRGAGMI